MNNLLHGDLGPSFTFKSRNVSDILEEATGYSLKIGFMALLLGTFLGVVSGTIAGMSSNRMVDGLFSFMGVSSLSMPSFIFGGFLVLLFSLRLNVLPAATLETPAHYILPVTALSLVPFAYSFLLIRTAVKETKKQAFVLIKRSFGINEVMVSLNHVLRNSLIPLVSILGPVAAALVTGSFAIETIFAVPGLGKHFVNGVMNRDYPLVMGITILYSVLLILFNTVTDILYSYLDPRLRSPSKVES
jgi:oligopeptide transport system permease protein